MREVGRQTADGAEHAGQRRHDDAADTELARHIERMDAAVAAHGDHGEIARIETAFDAHGADGARHCGVGDGADAVRGVLN